MKKEEMNMADLRMLEQNKVMLVGRLTRDPDLRYTKGGQAVANFSLAINSRYRDSAGKKIERASFIPIVVWGKIVERCNSQLKKGSPAFIEGRIQSRSWETKDGEKRNTLEIVAQRVQFLSRGGMDMHHHETPTSEAGGKTAAGGAKETGGK